MKRVLRWLPLLMWLGWIFALSHQPRPFGRTVSPELAAIIHTGEYAVLVVFAAYGAFGSGVARQRPRLTVVGCFLFAALYGLSDEYHQSFIPGRQMSTLDWGVDMLGAAIAAALVAVVGWGGPRYRRRAPLAVRPPGPPSTAPEGPEG